MADLSALFKLRPDRAADYLLAKGLKLTGPYWELDGPQHSHLFTVANLAKLDVLADIKGAVQQAIDSGETEKWFKDRLVGVLQQKGWWGPGVSVDPVTLEAKIIQQGSLRRLQTIYRTNLQTAYMAGRHRQALEQIDRAPWAQYLAIRDQRSRPAHAALHGQVFRIDSPAWAVIAPANGYNCRCRARYLSDRELANRGLKPAEDVRILEREPPGRMKHDPLTGEPVGTRPLDPLTGETPDRWIQRGISVPDPLKPGERLTLWADPGWDHLPGSDGAERLLVDQVMAKATTLSDGIREAVTAASASRASQWARATAATRPAILNSDPGSAYARAQTPGQPHHGWLLQQRKLTTPQLRKGVRALRQQIAEHRAAIADPRLKFAPDADPEEVAYHRDIKWPRDIARHEQQIAILEGVIYERDPTQ